MTLVYLAAAWTAGIALAGAIAIPWQILLLAGLVCALVFFLWHQEPGPRMVALCGFVLLLGVGRFLLAVPRFDERSLATYNDSGRVILEGVVIGEPDERDTTTNLRVRGRRLTLSDGSQREVDGVVLVTSGRYPRRQYGDYVRVQGSLATPQDFGDFSYRDYLARRNIHSVIRYAQVDHLARNQANPVMYHILLLKERVQATIAAILPEPQASLLSACLLGVDGGIPRNLMDEFSVTGAKHLIVVSGFHMTIVAGIFTGLAQRLFDRRRAIWVAIAAVLGYTVLVGASPGVVRAAFMGLLYLFGRYVGRPSYGPVSLAAAAIGMTAWNPHVLWDLPFLLSFTATAGLMLYSRPLERLMEGALSRVISTQRAEAVTGLVGHALLMTLAAQITMTPILIASFGQLSLVTLLTNFLLVPAQVYILLTGGLAAVVGLIFLPAGRVVAWIVWVLLTYTVEVVRITARLPSASLPVAMDSWLVWAYYPLLGGVTWWLGKPREKARELWGRVRSSVRLAVPAKVLAAGSVLIVILALSLWRGLPDGRLHVSFLDVGQGDAILIESPSGRRVLIDGGPSPSLLLSHLGRRMPFWDRSVDLVILSHPDADHIAGLIPVLERYRVGGVVFREVGCVNPTCAQWDRLVEERGITAYQGEAGMVIELDEGLWLEVLHPGPRILVDASFNDNSVVVRLTYGAVSMLLTGDIEARAEAVLLADGVHLASTVLKVAHHGSCHSSTPAFLDAVDPQLAVISVGEDNDFGHPCARVIQQLGGARVYRTDTHGTVTLSTDGTHLWVETERGGE